MSGPENRNLEEHLGCKISYGSQCEHYPNARSRSPRLYVLGTNAHAPRPSASNQHEPDFTCHHKRNDDVAMLDRFQCYAQHGAYFVRSGLRFFGISTRTTPLPIALSSHRRAGHAWRLCRALQSVLFQCASQRYQHFFGLLRRQHCAIAGLNNVLLTLTGNCNHD